MSSSTGTTSSASAKEPSSQAAPQTPSTTSSIQSPTTSITSSNLASEHKPPNQQKLAWTKHTEDLLASWGDISTCYKWMHEESFRKYYKINYMMAFPIIVLSTITGTVSVGMNSLVPPAYVDIAQQAVGGVNIITGIITTLQNYFRFAQLSESHQNSSVGWSKLERNIRVELKMDRKTRKDADSFMKVCRNEYDRLLEQSPVIPEDIISRFKQKFKNVNLVKPDVCDNLVHVEVTLPDAHPVEQKPQIVGDTSVLDQIKDMLSESRLVTVGVKDHELPPARRHSVTFPHAPFQPNREWRKATVVGRERKESKPAANQDDVELDDLSDLLHPRKTFLGPPPTLVKTQSMASINVKELMKKFNKPTDISKILPKNVESLVEPVVETLVESIETVEVKSDKPEVVEDGVKNDSIAIDIATDTKKENETALNKLFEATTSVSSFDTPDLTISTVKAADAVEVTVQHPNQVEDVEPSLVRKKSRKAVLSSTTVASVSVDGDHEEGSRRAPVMDINDLL